MNEKAVKRELQILMGHLIASNANLLVPLISTELREATGHLLAILLAQFLTFEFKWNIKLKSMQSETLHIASLLFSIFYEASPIYEEVC